MNALEIKKRKINGKPRLEAFIHAWFKKMSLIQATDAAEKIAETYPFGADRGGTIEIQFSFIMDVLIAEAFFAPDPVQKKPWSIKGLKRKVEIK